MRTLVVQAEDVARRLGLRQPLDADDLWLVGQAINDAQSDLEAYLGWPVTPQTYTQTGMLPFNGTYRLDNEPIISITSTTAEVDTLGRPTGYYTVVYVAGLDAANDPALEPIRRFIRTHATYSADMQALFRRLNPGGARHITSLSVEGQGVTYTDTYAVQANANELGLVGALPALSSCDQWRRARRRVHQAPSRSYDSWPYTYRPYSSEWSW